MSTELEDCPAPVQVQQPIELPPGVAKPNKPGRIRNGYLELYEVETGFHERIMTLKWAMQRAPAEHRINLRGTIRYELTNLLSLARNAMQYLKGNPKVQALPKRGPDIMVSAARIQSQMDDVHNTQEIQDIINFYDSNRYLEPGHLQTLMPAVDDFTRLRAEQLFDLVTLLA